MQAIVSLNGEILAPDDATISIWDRGFSFADSVYEVLRVYRGKLWLQEEHLARLSRSLREVRLQPIDHARMVQRINALLTTSGILEGTVYIQITRGVAPRSHPFPSPPVPPTELILVRAYDDTATAQLRQQGVSVVSRPDLRWGRCDIKSTNLLANVLALQEAKEAGGFEAALIDRDGHVTESTHSSLLWIRDGRLLGTPDGTAILPGTTRRALERLATQAEIAQGTERITLQQLLKSDEILLAGTTIEVMPVTKLDGNTIGDGTPGPITRSLLRSFQAAVLSATTSGQQPHQSSAR